MNQKADDFWDDPVREALLADEESLDQFGKTRPFESTNSINDEGEKRHQLDRMRRAVSLLRQTASSSKLTSTTVDPDETELREFQDRLATKSFSDRYRIVRCLGYGGFGVVYLADDDLLKRQVAMKTLRPIDLSRKVWPGDFSKRPAMRLD